MTILPIGIYGPYPPAGKATSCYLVDSGREKVVLDLGSGALSALQKYAKVQDISAFIVTHLHYDHCADVLPLSYVPGKHTVYAPCTPSERFSLIKAQQNIDTRVLSSNLRFVVGGMSFEFAQTNHDTECYAVKVTEGTHSFVYTSDTAWSDKLVNFCRGAKLVIADCLGSGSPHMTPREGAELAARTSVKVIATHLHPNTYENITVPPGIELIEEGKTIDLW